MSWANDYIGIPFKWHGSDRDGCSCWGLVCLVADEVFNKKLPRHDQLETNAKEGKGRIPTETFALDGYEIPMAEAREGDILHMWAHYQGKKLPLHVGIIVEPGKVLHIEEGTGAMVEDYRRNRCAWRVIGAYRFA